MKFPFLSIDSKELCQGYIQVVGGILNGLKSGFKFRLPGKYLISQGSLNYPFWGNQTMQMHGNFEGFPLNSALFGLVIY